MSDAEQTEQTRQFFDAAAVDWKLRYARDAAVGARLGRFGDAVHARLSPPASILDFGCGSGDIALKLAESGFTVTGFDLSEKMIEAARSADAQGRVTWLARDDGSAELPFADASFDGIVTSSVLEYVPALDVVMREFARVLRPGGWLIATIPDVRDAHRRREHWLRLALKLPGVAALAHHSRWREGAHYLRISINRLTARAWQQRLQASGLEPQPWPDAAGPLLLLVAQKPDGAAD